VNPFWSSHEEKRHWLEYSMGGHGVAHRRGERGGRRGGEGVQLGGAMGGRTARGAGGCSAC
jgi:hypothetical protein